MNRKPLFQQDLKLIACAAMLSDHIGVALLPQLQLFRVVGRLAFPIYCFLLTEGLRHTGSPGKYLLRLLLITALSELPFDLFRAGCFHWGHQSVMVTLTLGLLMGLTMRLLPRPAQPLAVIPFMLLAEYLRADYGAMGILIIALFLLTRQLERPLPFQLAGLLLILLICQQQLLQLCCLAALVPIGLYSGKKRPGSALGQWGFYLFYPVHLLALWLIGVF